MLYSNNTSSPVITSNILLENDFLDLTKAIHNTNNNLNIVSKEILNKKISLIEKASDMTTDEKITALNQSYDRHMQEKYCTLLMSISLTAVIATISIILSSNFSKPTRLSFQ